jgi:hypothetical protein
MRTHCLFGAALMSTIVVAGSCASKPARQPVQVDAWQPPALIAAVNGTLRVEFTPAIDRFTFFGPEKEDRRDAGTSASCINMLYVTGLDRTPPSNGDYTFFGGAYSWFAPQNGPMGWKDSAGKPSPWPPDPAMDIGPAVLTTRSERALGVIGPVLRSGLGERKSLTITGPYTAELTYTLDNRSQRTITAGPWLNTAVAPNVGGGIGSVLAFRVAQPGPNARVFERWGGMGDNAAERFTAALSAPTEHGWATLPLSKATWTDGIKVYLDSGESFAEIAVWRDGWWFHRRLLSGDGQTNKRLRELGEGPVATYINPALGIIEAELVAPIKDIPAGGKNTATERWTLIKSETPDAAVLPR